ncbi:hypothetical protein [Micromonospora taraxaci]|nr:hypothetical protein [Micromonospora taraxaci]
MNRDVAGAVEVVAASDGNRLALEWLAPQDVDMIKRIEPAVTW